MTSHEDHAIAIRIDDVLSSSPDIDRLSVTVEVADGEVRLLGLVGSFSERLTAMELASGIVAADRIRNEIVVRPYGADWSVSDQQIADDIRRHLHGQIVPPDDIAVLVDHHVVTLEGTLSSGAERAEVRHVVEAVRGVNIVHNRIVV